jgi:hypothetical protein
MFALILAAQVVAAVPAPVPATPRTLSDLALERRLTGPRSAPGTVSVAGAAYDPTARDIYRELAIDAENRRAAELEAARVAEPVTPSAPYVIWAGGSTGGGIRRHTPRPIPRPQPHTVVRASRPHPVRGARWQ